MIHGYLNEHKVKKLIDLGLDIEKVYDDNPQWYWIRLKTRPVTPREIKEDKDLDANSVVILETRVVIKNARIYPKDTKNTHYYLTIPLDFLVTFLHDRLIGGFAIDCSNSKANRAFLPYMNIQYMDKQEKQVFIPATPMQYSLEYLLCDFIEFLLKNKKHLIKKSFFD